MYNQQQKQQPLFKRRSGKMSTAIFNGQYGPFVVLDRYVFHKERQGNDQHEHLTLLLNDTQLLDAEFVLSEAKRWLAAQPKQQNTQQGGQQVPNPQQHGQTLQYNPPQPPTGGTQYPQNHPFG